MEAIDNKIPYYLWIRSEVNKMKQRFDIIFALVVCSIGLLSLNQVYGQEDEDTERQDKALFLPVNS